MIVRGQKGDTLGIQVYNSTLVVASDEFHALAVFAPLFTATTSAANQLASWLRFAVTSIDRVRPSWSAPQSTHTHTHMCVHTLVQPASATLHTHVLLTV